MTTLATPRTPHLLGSGDRTHPTPSLAGSNNSKESLLALWARKLPKIGFFPSLFSILRFFFLMFVMFSLFFPNMKTFKKVMRFFGVSFKDILGFSNNSKLVNL